MRLSLLTLLTIVLFCFIFQGCQNEKTFRDKMPELKGEYFGQTPPQKTPKLFAPGFVSTEFSEFGGCWSPDGKQLYWTMKGVETNVIVFSELKNDVWTKPEIVSFSGEYDDMHPFITNDGLTLFYASRRPTDSNPAPNTRHDIWYVTKNSTGWSAPKHASVDINATNDILEMRPTVASNGNLYYTWFDGRKVGVNRCKFVDNKYSAPENMLMKIDSTFSAGHAFIAPDESYILLTARVNPGALDIFISYNNGNDKWSKPINLGVDINTFTNEGTPFLSADGKYLFFTSYRKRKLDPIQKDSYTNNYEQYVKDLQAPGHNGGGDLYWVKADLLKTLKNSTEVFRMDFEKKE